ncbi:hypothetical protein KI387_040183, partial [Taxus chinensis]
GRRSLFIKDSANKLFTDSRNSELEGRKVWKVVGDLTARKEIPIIEFESEQPVIEDYNYSSSGSDSDNPIADLNSPS